MKIKNTKFLIFLIIVAAFIAAGFLFPSYLNKGIKFVNEKTSLNIPQASEKSFKLGLDLQGGTHLIYEADLSNVDKVDQSSVMQGLRDVIERRVNYYGIQEPLIQTEEVKDSYRLIVDLAGIKNVSEAIDMIGKTPFLEFKKEKSQEETDKIIAKQKELEGKTFEEIQNVENWVIAYEDPYFESTELTGQYLRKAEVSYDQTTYNPMVSLTFDDTGANLFEKLTSENIGKKIAIVIDGELISAPNVNEKIAGGKAQITGKFSDQEAKEMARNLNAGALPVPIKLISEETIGPSLGANSLNQSFNAGIWGFIAVFAFMVILYRFLGLTASFALILYVIFTLFLLRIFSVTITLSGIGGFILSIGMAVDANILIFSRMREELKSGKTFSQALNDGFNRAWPSIRDGNVTVLLVAGILFFFGTSFVKGFALTLSMGTFVTFFTAVFITRNLLKLFENGKLSKVKWLWD